MLGGLNNYSYVDGMPTTSSDYNGLVRWDGTGVLFAAIFEFGVVSGRFSLRSECVNNRDYYAQISVIGSALGAGLQLTGAGSTYTLMDDSSVPDPQSLAGVFEAVFAGVAGGGGIGITYLQLGDAGTGTEISPSPEYGVDASVGVTAGRSFLSYSMEEKCNCASSQ